MKQLLYLLLLTLIGLCSQWASLSGQNTYEYDETGQLIQENIAQKKPTYQGSKSYFYFNIPLTFPVAETQDRMFSPHNWGLDMGLLMRMGNSPLTIGFEFGYIRRGRFTQNIPDDNWRYISLLGRTDEDEVWSNPRLQTRLSGWGMHGSFLLGIAPIIPESKLQPYANFLLSTHLAVSRHTYRSKRTKEDAWVNESAWNGTLSVERWWMTGGHVGLRAGDKFYVQTEAGYLWSLNAQETPANLTLNEATGDYEPVYAPATRLKMLSFRLGIGWKW